MSMSTERRIAFIDLDGTIYPGLLMENLVMEQMQKGLLDLTVVPDIIAEINQYKSGKKGDSSNVKALNELWAWACRGRSWLELVSHAKEFVHENREKFAPYTEAVFNLLRRRRYERWIVTGEPQFVAYAVKEEFGATSFCATCWESPKEDNQLVFNGICKRPMNSDQKGAWAEGFFKETIYRRPNTREGSIALIDSVNDIGLAKAVRWSIVCGDEPSTELIGYLKKSEKNFVISPPEFVVNLVDLLTTDGRNELPASQLFLVYSQL